MKLFQSILEAFESLNANKLRSMLTVLGIVIGVAAVVAMLSIGQGAQQAITSQIESIGTNLIYVSPGSSRQEGVVGAAGSAGTLTQDDATALEQVPNVVVVAPEVDSSGQIVFMGQNTRTRILGVTPDYFTLRNYSMADGEFISNSNLVSRSAVVVLGSAVADTLFGGVIGAVGQSIRINGQQFRVIGVLASKGGTGFLSQDDQVIMPMTTVQFRLVGRNTFRGANVINTINIQVNSPNAVTQAKTDITAVMRDRHQTSAGTDDFTVTSQQDVLGAITTVTNTLSIFLGGIAGISLLVGGIGIMNIMLTTVSERTREIGLRKAIGARRRDILYQFLIEAMTLSLLGGVIGIFFGWLIGQVIGKIQLGGSTLTAVVSPNSVLLATLFSMAVGLFFGSYPAVRAARLLPVEALRYE